MNGTLCLIVGYLLGSLPFAVIVSRLMGLGDPRQYGSGNPGATNVLRSGNKRAALLTLLGDVGKGTLAVLLCRALGADALGVALAGLAAFVGHVFPIFLKFRGGKGVATALGVLLGLDIVLALAALSAWLITAAVSRYSSLSALVAALAAPLMAFLQTGFALPTPVVGLMSLLLILRHRDNIIRLAHGIEPRIGARRE